MQQSQYDALVAKFAEWATRERETLPEQTQVISAFSHDLSDQTPQTDQERAEALTEAVGMLNYGASMLQLRQLFGDPFAESCLVATAVMLAAIEMAQAVSNATVVQVTVSAEG